MQVIPMITEPIGQVKEVAMNVLGVKQKAQIRILRSINRTARGRSNENGGQFCS